jgi:hypothetical protein
MAHLRGQLTSRGDDEGADVERVPIRERRSEQLKRRHQKCNCLSRPRRRLDCHVLVRQQEGNDSPLDRRTGVEAHAVERRQDGGIQCGLQFRKSCLSQPRSARCLQLLCVLCLTVLLERRVTTVTAAKGEQPWSSRPPTCDCLSGRGHRALPHRKQKQGYREVSLRSGTA